MVLLVATAVSCSAARGSVAVKAVVAVEGRAVAYVVAFPPAWARTRGGSKLWGELGAEAFTAKVTLGTGGNALFPPLAWTSTTGPQQPASSISDTWNYRELRMELLERVE